MSFKHAITIAILTVAVGGCAPITQGRYDTVQNAVGANPKLKQNFIQSCIAKEYRNSARELQYMGRILGVPPKDAMRVFCTRVINALADKRITHTEFMKSLHGNPPPNVYRILKGR